MTGHDSYQLGVVIVAAGSGERFGKQDKILAPLAGKPILSHSLHLFSSLPDVREIVVVAASHTIERACTIAASAGHPNIRVCAGGATRRDSVRAGIDALSPAIDLVAVHDAARPLVPADVVTCTIAAAAGHGAAVPTMPVSDTLYRLGADGEVQTVEDRSALSSAQTPQVARRDWLEKALAATESATDEGSALVAAGFNVRTVQGSPENIKITWPTDLLIADAILQRRAS